MHKLIGRSICVILAVGALGACSKKDKAKVEQKINQVRHDTKSCPKLADGHYQMEDGATVQRPKFIDVSRDDSNNLVVSFDNEDKLVANGKEQKLSDGAVFTVTCTNDGLRVAGMDERNERTSITLSGTDLGIKAELSEPEKMTVIYRKADILEEGLDKGAKALEDAGKAAKDAINPEPGTAPQGDSGIPRATDLVPPQPMPQQQ